MSLVLKLLQVIIQFLNFQYINIHDTALSDKAHHWASHHPAWWDGRMVRSSTKIWIYTMLDLHSLKLNICTASVHLKMDGTGRRSGFLFGVSVYFQGRTVSFKECNLNKTSTYIVHGQTPANQSADLVHSVQLNPNCVCSLPFNHPNCLGWFGPSVVFLHGCIKPIGNLRHLHRCYVGLLGTGILRTTREKTWH